MEWVTSEWTADLAELTPLVLNDLADVPIVFDEIDFNLDLLEGFEDMNTEETTPTSPPQSPQEIDSDSGEFF